MSTKKLRLIVIRHGETPSNLTGVVTGRSEDSLTANGKNQMLQIRRELLDLQAKLSSTSKLPLSNNKPSVLSFPLAVYSSPMKRCVESVQIVAPEYDPIYDDRLAERDLGELGNYTIDELWEQPLWNSLEVTRMGSGAETLLSGLERVKSFLASLKEKYPEGGDLLIITHSFISRCLWIITENIQNPEKMSTFLHRNDEIKEYSLTF